MIHTELRPANRIPNKRYSRMVREGEAIVREFANRHGLPIVLIDGLPRPILASGMWNMRPLLTGDNDEEFYELDPSVGLGHIVPPFERSIEIATDWLTNVMRMASKPTWIHARNISYSLRCRDGALIISADRLQIPMRHFDYAMVDVELLLPVTYRELAKTFETSPTTIGKTNG